MKCLIPVVKCLAPVVALMLLSAASPVSAQSHQFRVEHKHTFGGCRGTLVMTPEKIEYQTGHGKHARQWTYIELQQVKIESKTVLELLTYEDQKRLAGRDRAYRFKLLEDEITPDISAFLMTKATRPLVTSVPTTTEGTPRFEVQVKHLHNFGGCSGALKIYADRLTFESAERSEHSRFWRYSDLQGFSQSSRYRIEISSVESQPGVADRNFNFQLKEEFPASAYDYIWARIYPSKFQWEVKENAEHAEQLTRNSRKGTVFSAISVGSVYPAFPFTSQTGNCWLT